MASFNFSEEYVLEDDRIRLRPIEVKDINNLLQISEESGLWTYFLEKGNGIENLTKYIKSTIENRKLGKEYPFIIYDKKKKKYAGTTRFYEYSPVLKILKLGHTWYGNEFRGTGLNKHCKYLLFQFAFDVLNVERIGFGASIENKISIAAMQSVGCTKEGILRNFLPSSIETKRVDLILLSILKAEWNTKVREDLMSKLESIN